MLARRTSSPARVAQALLLRRVEYGDSDLVVTLLTDTIGRVSALARGARKSVKRFGGVIEPMHTLQIAYDDRSSAELVVLREAKLLRARPFLVMNLERMQAAGRALGWVRKAAPPRTPEPEVWAAMEQLLDHLADEADAVSPRARLAATGLQLLAAFGWGIDFTRCVSCGKAPAPGQAAALDAARGGLVCRACGGARHRLSGSARVALSRAAEAVAELDEEHAVLALELVEQALKAHGGIE